MELCLGECSGGTSGARLRENIPLMLVTLATFQQLISFWGGENVANIRNAVDEANEDAGGTTDFVEDGTWAAGASQI